MSRVYHYPHPFTTEGGFTFPSLDIAYDTYGEMNEAKSNVIWVCHALTANSDVADWWPHTVEEGCFLDPAKYFTVCANFLGSHYGTTGPHSINPATGEKWYSDFPLITVRDMVRVHQLLAEHLGIKRVKLLIGSSIGGFQCLEWAVMQPDFAQKAAFIATTPRTLAWASGFNESQRMAIRLDPTWGQERDDAGIDGMAVARSIALISYRGGSAYNATQQEADEDCLFADRAGSYQRYQGKKLSDRFDAYSYYYLSDSVNSNNAGRGRGGVEKALGSIKADCTVIGIDSDRLFPVCEQKLLASCIPGAKYHELTSKFGHDGFLLENDQLTAIIEPLL